MDVNKIILISLIDFFKDFCSKQTSGQIFITNLKFRPHHLILTYKKIIPLQNLYFPTGGKQKHNIQVSDLQRGKERVWTIQAQKGNCEKHLDIGFFINATSGLLAYLLNSTSVLVPTYSMSIFDMLPKMAERNIISLSQSYTERHT